MALTQSLPDPTGTGDYTAYLRIERLETDFSGRSAQPCRIVLGACRSAEARTAGKNPVQRFVVNLTPQQWASTLANNATTYAAVAAVSYDTVKADPRFAAAQDA